MALPHLPKSSTVEQKYRCFARTYLTLAASFVVSVIGSELYSIYRTRGNPPTTNTMIDARLGQPWGRMPSIVIKELWSPIESLQYGSYGWSWPHYFKKTNPDEADPSIKMASPQLMLINMTTVSPRFDVHLQGGMAKALEVPELPLWLTYPESVRWRGFDVFTLSSDAPPELWRNIANATFDATAFLKYQCQLYLPLNKVFSVEHFLITKSILPKQGLYWGWPWEEDHTADFFTLTIGHSEITGGTYPNQASLRMVPNPLITKMVPIGLWARLGTAFSRLGGYCALISFIFYSFFVRKYPSSISEHLSSILTLFYSKQQDRPDVEAWDQTFDLGPRGVSRPLLNAA